MDGDGEALRSGVVTGSRKESFDRVTHCNTNELFTCVWYFTTEFVNENFQK